MADQQQYAPKTRFSSSNGSPRQGTPSSARPGPGLRVGLAWNEDNLPNGHINERGCVRWLAHPPDDPERDRMAALFAETVADPLTRSVIADLLNAVR